jgi:hypothetical protein
MSVDKALPLGRRAQRERHRELDVDVLREGAAAWLVMLSGTLGQLA